MASPLRVLDVQEKEIGEIRAPSLPTGQATPLGFPAPKKRSRFSSKLKQQREAAEAAAATAATPPMAGPKLARFGKADTEKARIDRENRQRLQDMGSGEIAQAREELLSNLDPALLQILLRRANLDEGNESLPEPVNETTKPTRAPKVTKERPTETRKTKETKEAIQPNDTTDTTDTTGTTDMNKAKAVQTNAPTDAAGTDTAKTPKTVRFADADAALDNSAARADLVSITTPADVHTHSHAGHADHAGHAGHADTPTMHFPHRPADPDLDPADPDFLQHLHAKYFPSLPADPARLAWMAPLPTTDSPADRASPYYPGQATVAVSQLRFDFRGRLVSPRASRAIPVSKGLHHHGEAPEAAGYTVAELARLARSAVPAQRCVAFQTLGRLLFRLGQGEWGSATANVDKDPRAAVAQGIWRCVQEGRVLDTLREAATADEAQGHRGSRAYAIEAIWLFEKGGWKDVRQGR